MGQLGGAGRAWYLSSHFHHFFSELWRFLIWNNHRLRCLRPISHAWEHQRKVFISFSTKSNAFFFDLPAPFVLLSICRETIFMDESVQQFRTLLITANERHLCSGWKASDRDGIVNEPRIASHIANSGWTQLTPRSQLNTKLQPKILFRDAERQKETKDSLRLPPSQIVGSATILHVCTRPSSGQAHSIRGSPPHSLRRH